MPDAMSMEGKTIVVSGAAQGIGQGVASLAIGLGARVVGVDLNGDKLNALAAAMSGRLLPYVGSVADPEFTEATVSDVKARIGAIDGLVNNAGITRPAMIEKMTLQQWSEVITVHLTGAFLWTQAVGRLLFAQGKAGRLCDLGGGILTYGTGYRGGRGLSYLGLTPRLHAEIGGWPYEQHGQFRYSDTRLSYASYRGVPLKSPAWIYAKCRIFESCD